MESLLEQLENENENPVYYFFNDDSELEVTNEQAYDIVEKFGSLSDENKEMFLDKIAESKNFKSYHPFVIHRVKTFTEEDCNKIEKTVDDLDKLWVNRSCERRFSYETETDCRAPFWTLGAVSYLDSVASPDTYNKHKNYLNPVLRKKKLLGSMKSSAKNCKENLANLSSLITFLFIHTHLTIYFRYKNWECYRPEYLKLFEEPDKRI